MNVKVTLGGVITLPTDVLEELKLEPGSEVSFDRGPGGKFLVGKVEAAPSPTREPLRDHLRQVSKTARAGLSKDFVGMTTDEFMEFIRGD